MTSNAIPLYCDNNRAIALARSRGLIRNLSTSNDGFIRTRLPRKEIYQGARVDSTDNVANPVTKQLSQIKMKVHLEKMGLRFMAN